MLPYLLSFIFAQKSYKSNSQISGVQGICRRISSNDHLSPTATFLADSPYIDSCFNLSTTVTLSCPQGGCCGEVQLYNRRPQDSRTRTTTSTRFDFKFFSYSQKNKQPGMLHCTFCHQKKLAGLFLLQWLSSLPITK